MWNRQTKVPYKPKMKNIKDHSNFDKMFTGEAARDSSILQSSLLLEQEGEHFIDFTYLDNGHLDKKQVQINF